MKIAIDPMPDGSVVLAFGADPLRPESTTTQIEFQSDAWYAFVRAVLTAVPVYTLKSVHP